MNVVAPQFLVPVTSDDIVGFNVVAQTGDSPAAIISFGQYFKDGQLDADQGLETESNGIAGAVQIDAKTFYADGSVKFAVLTTRQPAVAANSTVQELLRKTPPTSTQYDVDVASLLSSHSALVTLSFDNGIAITQDIFSALSTAISSGVAEYWQRGSLATQVRTSIEVQDSLRLVATLTAFADGTYSLAIGFNNDAAMTGQGGTKTYSASISLDGLVAAHTDQITQYQYQNWNTTVWGGGGQQPTATIQHDPTYLEQAGAIPNFNLQNGSDSSIISYYASQISAADWGKPLSNNDVEMLMPMTGGRPDIGITTEPNAVWMITQDPIAQRFALGQADASGAVPWNFWNAQSGTWLNTDQYSNIWTDNRGGTSDSGSSGLTQQVSDQTGWIVDTSHQPDLSYYAFLMTGDEKYLDSLNAQASSAITSTWEAYRGSEQIVVGFDQVRASAWNMREIDEAAWANPADSAAGLYFTKIANANWSWLVSQIPNWTAKQGEAYGQVEGYAWGSRDYSRPWMQDYFASVAAEAARHGNNDALTFLEWESNFLVGRFLNGANGFNPHDGVSYTIAMGPDSSDGNVRYQTWAEIGQATAAAGESNGDGWANSIGDYGSLGLVSLADIISVTGSTDAIRAYNFLITSGAPFTSSNDLSHYNQFNIVPDLPTGWAFAPDRTIIQSAPLLPAVSVVSITPSSTLTASSLVGHTDPIISGDLPSGVDPLIMPTGNDAPMPGSAQPTYRFFDKINGTQFLTSNIDERDNIIQNSTQLIYEGQGINAVAMDSGDSNAAPVFRFFNSTNGTHFFTVSSTERDAILLTRSDLVQEQASFAEHLKQQPGDTAVFRFFDTHSGDHFFTQSSSEVSEIMNTRPDMLSEGVAFYAPSQS